MLDKDKKYNKIPLDSFKNYILKIFTFISIAVSEDNI